MKKHLICLICLLLAPVVFQLSREYFQRRPDAKAIDQVD